MKRMITGITLAATLLLVAAPAAMAGEITGNGKSLEPLHGRSICAYSGLNDDPLGLDPDNGPPGRVQSWGQLPKETRVFLTSIGVSPGQECSPGRP